MDKNLIGYGAYMKRWLSIWVMASMNVCAIWAQNIRMVPSTPDSLYALPIIIHIIHQGEEIGAGTNLSTSRLMSQIEVLNQDFRREPDTPGANSHSDSRDSFIEFFPAALDPSGFPLSESGIDRVDAIAQGWQSPPYSEGYIASVIQPQTQWDPARYINIWVLERAALLGQAQFPDSSGLNLLEPTYGQAHTDGLVIDTEEWGANTLNFGRIATHEMGHYLGLLHTWGKGGCDSDDGCEDTPSAMGPTVGCPVNQSSCGSVDMTENYMDLTSGFCQNVFTHCQVQRMRQVLERSPRRRDLASSPVNQVPAEPPLAQFRIDESQLTCNGKVRFWDESLNKPFFWQWDFGNGTTSSDPNPLATYSEPGVFQVRLTVRNFKGSSEVVADVEVCIVSSTEEKIQQFLQIQNPVWDPDLQRLTLPVQIKEAGNLSIHLIDLTGREVQTVFQGHLPPGERHFSLSGSTLPSGMYIVLWEIEGLTVPVKVLIP